MAHTKEVREAAFRAFIQCRGNCTHAAASIGVDTKTVCRWRDEENWEDALADALVAEEEVLRIRRRLAARNILLKEAQ